MKMKPCQSDARQANVDNVLNRYITTLEDTVKQSVPNVKWKKDCLNDVMVNPRGQNIFNQIQNYVEQAGTMPLDS